MPCGILPGYLVRWNAIGCGILFIVLGRYVSARRRKAHFEPAAVHLGWLLILGALVSGGLAHGPAGIGYAALLIVTGAGLAWHGFRRRRFALFACGVLGGYIAASQLVLKASPDFIETCVWFIASATALVTLLWTIQRKMKEPQ